MMKTPILLALIALLSSCAMGLKSIPATEIEKKYANPVDHSKFITINGTRVHYRDQGNASGEPLILLHGIVSSLHTWDGWVKQLENKYRIIRIDIPGFGLTGGLPGDEYTAENYVEFMDGFTDALKIRKASIAGNSLGGFIAWNFAKSHPHKVNKLILIDPAGYPYDPPWIVQMVAVPGVAKTSQFISPRFVTKWTLNDIYGDKFSPTPDIVDRYYEILLKEGNREMFAKVFIDLLKYRNYDPSGIKEIKAPTLIMWGKQDTFIPTKQHKLWKRDLPNAKIILYDGVGHIPMEESPQQTAEDADNFLSL